MRTLRNATFVVLCAMVYLAPAQAVATSCQINYTTGGGCYVGQCEDCNDGYDFVFHFCGGQFAEYFCDGQGGSYLRFCCTGPIMD